MLKWSLNCTFVIILVKSFMNFYLCERLYLTSFSKGSFLSLCEKGVRIMVKKMEVKFK
jgi:hypothetical protein